MTTSTTNEILDAIDHARDEAVGRAFQSLVTFIGDNDPDPRGKFGRALQHISQAHALATEAAKKGVA